LYKNKIYQDICKDKKLTNIKFCSLKTSENNFLVFSTNQIDDSAMLFVDPINFNFRRKEGEYWSSDEKFFRNKVSLSLSDTHTRTLLPHASMQNIPSASLSSYGPFK
jgi:hypothetical protein